MSLHFLDPDKAPRECPSCIDVIPGEMCTRCEGTGTLGDPEAKPDIEINFDGQVFWYRSPGETVLYPHECYETEAEALTAAREGGAR